MIQNAKYAKKENYFSSYDREDHKMSKSKGNVLTYVKCSITGQKAQGRAKSKADVCQWSYHEYLHQEIVRDFRGILLSF